MSLEGFATFASGMRREEAARRAFADYGEAPPRKTPVYQPQVFAVVSRRRPGPVARAVRTLTPFGWAVLVVAFAVAGLGILVIGGGQ